MLKEEEVGRARRMSHGRRHPLLAMQRRPIVRRLVTYDERHAPAVNDPGEKRH